MSPEQKYFYHPFENSSLQIFIKNHRDHENHTEYLIENIDLYYQPLEKPWIATLFAFLRVLVVVISEMINIKVFKAVKEETGLLSGVTKFFLVTQMIYLPLMMIFIITTDFIHPVNKVIGQWFCTCGWSTFVFGGIIISSHSFKISS